MATTAPAPAAAPATQDLKKRLAPTRWPKSGARRAIPRRWIDCASSAVRRALRPGHAHRAVRRGAPHDRATPRLHRCPGAPAARRPPRDLPGRPAPGRPFEAQDGPAPAGERRLTRFSTEGRPRPSVMGRESNPYLDPGGFDQGSCARRGPWAARAGSSRRSVPRTRRPSSLTMARSMKPTLAGRRPGGA